MLNTVKGTISDLEGKTEEVTQNVGQRKCKGKYEKGLRNMEGRVSSTNIHIIWVLRRNNIGEHTTLKDSMTEYFPGEIKNPNLKPRRSPKVPNTTSKKKYTQVTNSKQWKHREGKEAAK